MAALVAASADRLGQVSAIGGALSAALPTTVTPYLAAGVGGAAHARSVSTTP